MIDFSRAILYLDLFPDFKRGSMFPCLEWGSGEAGFTLLFDEALAQLICQLIPVASVAKAMEASANTL